MKKAALKKDFWMEIKKSRGRFMSLFLIVALGVSFFAGIRSSEPDMRLSGDVYFDEERLMDLKVVSTFGITEDDIRELSALESIQKVEGGYSVDVLCNVNDHQKVMHVMSILPTMNHITVEEGRLPENEKECLVDSDFLEKNDYKVGQTIRLTSGSIDRELADSLKHDTYTIVGAGSSPCYISFSRGSSQVGTGEVSGFIAVRPEEFAMEVYTEAYAFVKGAAGEVAFTEDYDAKIERAEDEIGSIKKMRCEARYDEIVSEAEGKLNEAKEELADGRAEAAKELAKAAQKIADGEQALQDGMFQISDGRKQLKDARELLTAKQKELDDGRKEYASGLRQYESGRKEFEKQEKDFYANLPERQKAIADGEAEMEAKLAEGRAELDKQWEQYRQMENALNETKKALAELQKQLDDAKEDEAAAWVMEQMKAKLPEMKEGIRQLEEELDRKRSELAGKQKAYEGLAEAKNAAGSELQAAENTLEALYKERDALTSEGAEVPETLIHQITDAEAALAGKQAAYNEAAKSAADAENEIKNLETQIQEGEKALQFLNGQIEKIENAKPEDLDELAGIIAGLKDQIRKLEELLETQDALKEYRAQLEAGEQEFEAQAAAGRAQIADAKKQLADGEQALKDAKKKLGDSRRQLDAALRKLEDGQRQINQGWKELQTNKKKLDDAELEIKENDVTLAEGKEEYEDKKQEAEEKFAEAEEEISKAEKDIAEIEKPVWYIMNRSMLPDFSSYGDNAERMRAIGKVFPVLFFLVAALISLTSMTRMVEEQRTQIGTLKALGYDKLSIAGKYLNYALLATIGGSIVGVLFGEKVFPFIIIFAYKIMYQHMPQIVIPYNLSYAVMATLAAVACTFLATLFSCYKELASTPAVLMRPPAPKEGKRILLEHIPFLWKRFNFTWKSTFRNLIRYKKRFFMTVFGIGGCMALMLVGFGLKDSIYCILDYQYGVVTEYDGSVYLDEEASPSGKEALKDYFRTNADVAATAEVKLKMIDVKSGKITKSPYITVVENEEEFRKLVHLQNRTTKEKLSLSDDGVIINEKLAKMLNVEAGDEITLLNDETGDKKVKITGICENYLGHYVYMNEAVYEKLYGEKPDYNSIYFELKEEDTDALNRIGEDVLAYPDVLNIAYANSMHDRLDDMLKSLNLVIVVLIISAGALAFIVLYNLNTINITERQREIATLKVLGFYDNEVSAYVYRENILLTFVGALAGCGLGWLLHRYIIVTVEVEEIMFGRRIDLTSYLYSLFFTVGFSVIVNLVMHFKLKKINMVESLKSVE